MKPAHKDTFVLDRPFVLTQDKTLIIGMPYMYSEGNRTAAVRLVKTCVEDSVVNLKLEELQSPKSFTASWNLDYSGGYYLWTLADLPTLINKIKEYDYSKGAK